ncbi:hypothetical protein ABZV40_46280, partial [Lentzea sp. NPDC004782]
LNGLSRRDAGLNNNDGSPLIQPDVVTLSGITPSDKKPLISVSAVKRSWAGSDPVVLSEDEEKAIIGWRRGVGGRQFLVEHIVDVLRDEERSAQFMLRDGKRGLKSKSAQDVLSKWAKGMYSENDKYGSLLTQADVVTLSGITPSDKKPLVRETIVRDSWRAADPVSLSDEEEESIVGWRRGDDGPDTLVGHIKNLLGEVRFAKFIPRDGNGRLKSRVARDVIWRWAARLNGKHDTDESRFTAPVVAALSGTTPDGETLISRDTVDTTWSADPVRLSEYEEESILGWRRGDDGPDTLVGHIKNLLGEVRFAAFMLRSPQWKGVLKSWVARDVVWRWAAGMNGENDEGGSPLTQIAVAKLSGKHPFDDKTLITETAVKDSWLRVDPVRLPKDQEKAIIGWRRGDGGKDFLVDYIKSILSEVRFAKFILRDGKGGLRFGEPRKVVSRWAAGMNGEKDHKGSPLTQIAVAKLSGNPPSDKRTLIHEYMVSRLWGGLKEREVGGGEVGADRGGQSALSGGELVLRPASAPLGGEGSEGWSGQPQALVFPAGTYGGSSGSDQLMSDVVGLREPGADPGMDLGPDGQGAGVFFPALVGNLAGDAFAGHLPAGDYLIHGDAVHGNAIGGYSTDYLPGSGLGTFANPLPFRGLAGGTTSGTSGFDLGLGLIPAAGGQGAGAFFSAPAALAGGVTGGVFPGNYSIDQLVNGGLVSDYVFDGRLPGGGLAGDGVGVEGVGGGDASLGGEFVAGAGVAGYGEVEVNGSGGASHAWNAGSDVLAVGGYGEVAAPLDQGLLLGSGLGTFVNPLPFRGLTGGTTSGTSGFDLGFGLIPAAGGQGAGAFFSAPAALAGDVTGGLFPGNYSIDHLVNGGLMNDYVFDGRLAGGGLAGDGVGVEGVGGEVVGGGVWGEGDRAGPPLISGLEQAGQISQLWSMLSPDEVEVLLREGRRIVGRYVRRPPVFIEKPDQENIDYDNIVWLVAHRYYQQRYGLLEHAEGPEELAARLARETGRSLIEHERRGLRGGAPAPRTGKTAGVGESSRSAGSGVVGGGSEVVAAPRAKRPRLSVLRPAEWL